MDVPVDGDVVVVSWDVSDATSRYPDGGVVELPLAESLISITEASSTVPLRLVVYLPSGTATGAVASLAHTTERFDDGVVLLSGLWRSWNDTTAAVLVPAGSVESAPLGDGTAQAAFASEDASIRAHTSSIFADPFATTQRVGTIALTIAAAFGLGLWMMRLARATGRRAWWKVSGLRQREQPPDGLDPALAGAIAGRAGRGDRSVIAATILDLAARGVVKIDGITSERYVLTVPGHAAVTGGEEAVVLQALRAAGTPKPDGSVELTGPPLWGTHTSTKAWEGSYLRALGTRLRKANLVQFVFPMAIFFVLSIVCGTFAAMALPTSGLGVVLATLGPWVAIVAGLLSGTAPTKAGLRLRAQGEAYGRYLRDQTELVQVGAPGVVVWGQTLAYAAALGASPKAAGALAPRGSEHVAG
jgi:hypothetical protein